MFVHIRCRENVSVRFHALPAQNPGFHLRPQRDAVAPIESDRSRLRRWAVWPTASERSETCKDVIGRFKFFGHQTP